MILDEVNASRELTDESAMLFGYSIEATGSTEIIIKNGNQNAIFILLGDGETLNEDFRNPLTFSDGLYFNVVSGTVVGTVFWEPELSGMVLYPFRDETPVRKKEF